MNKLRWNCNNKQSQSQNKNTVEEEWRSGENEMIRSK